VFKEQKKSSPGRHSSLFVTGTDTAVGKTFVCALLLEFLRGRGVDAGYQKWVSTGTTDGDLPDDLAFCLQRAGLQSPSLDRLPVQAPFRFAYPASPHLAAELEGREIDPAGIIASYAALSPAHDFLIVEGVGGVLVPLRRDLLLADLVAHLGLTTLIVARTGLGTLNHTLLTLEALRSRCVPILGVVLSDASDMEDEVVAGDNLRTIAEIGKVKVFGRLERFLDRAAATRGFMPIGQAIVAAMQS